MSEQTLTAHEAVDPGVVESMQDRLRSMHVTLLFMAVLLCILVAMNILVLAAD
jgi:hypothetical protein